MLSRASAERKREKPRRFSWLAFLLREWSKELKLSLGGELSKGAKRGLKSQGSRKPRNPPLLGHGRHLGPSREGKNYRQKLLVH
jgi:hypothetical protein